METVIVTLKAQNRPTKGMKINDYYSSCLNEQKLTQILSIENAMKTKPNQIVRIGARN